MFLSSESYESRVFVRVSHVSGIPSYSASRVSHLSSYVVSHVCHASTYLVIHVSHLREPRESHIFVIEASYFARLHI